jgi:predicted RecB family endonuclease
VVVAKYAGGTNGTRCGARLGRRPRREVDAEVGELDVVDRAAAANHALDVLAGTHDIDRGTADEAVAA